jgi:hypothetical protein
MDVTTAARVVALRPALEALIAKTTADPESLSANDALDLELVQTVEGLSNSDACRHAVVTADGEAPRYCWSSVFCFAS